MDLTMQTQLNKHWGWFLAFGIILIILGVIALSLAAFTTLLTMILLGELLLIGGIFVLFDTFKFWRHKFSTMILHLLMALLYLVMGILLIGNPLSAAITLTLILAIFFITMGVFRILSAIILRLPFWGWRLFSGFVTLLLGMLVTLNWPASSLFVIGLFIGIDLLFFGWSNVILALSAKKKAAA